MKHLFLILICSSVFLSGKAQLSWEVCQEKAKQNYPAIKQYGLIEKSKEYSIASINKAWLPQFLLTGKASYQSDVTSIPMSTIQLPKDQYQVSLELNQTIWDGGVSKAQRKDIKASSEVEQQRLNVDLYNLEERINQLFFGILLLDEQLEQNHLLLDILDKNYQTVGSYLNHGIANQADLDAVRVEQLNAKQKQTHLLSSRQAYLTMLSAMIGEEVNSLIKPELMGEVDSRQINRPELELFDYQSLMYESKKDLIESATMPRLSLFVQGGYGKPGLNMLASDFDTYYIGGVSLSWNISSFYTKKNDLRKIDISRSHVDIQRETFLYNLNLNIIQENEDIKRLRELKRDDEEIIRLRENIRLATEAKVANGTSTVTDLMRELNQESIARQSKAAHEIELLMAIYKLKNTTNN